MRRTPVTSSNIASVGYDAVSATLEIEFYGGSVYQYFDVPEVEYQGLMHADSHGKYLNANIKDRYRYTRL